MFAGGGCCDCGDPESWAVEGFCKYHKGPSETSKMLKLDANVEMPCRMLCGYLIYILSHAFSTQYNDVIYLPKEIATQSSFSVTKNEFLHNNDDRSKIESFPNSVINHTSARKEFILYLHNDDTHNFDEGFVLFCLFFCLGSLCLYACVFLF